MTKDISKKQFDEACKRHGFKPDGFLGYYDLGLSNQRRSISVLNAGDIPH